MILLIYDVVMVGGDVHYFSLYDAGVWIDGAIVFMDGDVGLL
jgi:hypothetical protein